MLSFHEILIKLRNDLGYKTKDEGVCALYAEKAIDAFLVGEYETVFKARVDYIEKNYEQLPALLQRVKEERKAKSIDSLSAKGEKSDRGGADELRQRALLSQERQMIYEVAAFIEQGELYMHPVEYPGFFGESLSQGHVQRISQYAQSDKLEALGGRAYLASLIGVYSQEALTNYIKEWNQLAKASQADFALSLSSDNHRIGLCYSHVKKSWLLIDANNHRLDPIPANDSKASTLANELLVAFFDSQDNITAFEMKIFTSGRQQPFMQEQVNIWKQRQEVHAIHEVSPTNLMLKTARGVTLPWMAVKSGHADVLRALMEVRNTDGSFVVDFNQADELGVTLANMAAFKGNAEVLRVFTEVRNPDGSLVVDFNQPSNAGGNPACIAAEMGYVDILRVLMDLKNTDSSFVVDFNQASNSGVTPAYIAAQNGRVEVFRVLMEVRNPDGSLAVDFNYPTNEGVTPAYIAAQNGHVEVLRVLMDARKSDGSFVVDFNHPSNEGVTPAYIAAENGHVEVLRVLMDARKSDGSFVVDFNHPSNEGVTPAYIAAEKGHVDVLRALMALRDTDDRLVVDFNQADELGIAPIHLAAFNGQLEIVNILLGLKVKLTSLYQGQSPLQIAADRCHFNVVMCIKKALRESEKTKVVPPQVISTTTQGVKDDTEAASDSSTNSNSNSKGPT